MTAARVPKRTPLNSTAARKIIDRFGSFSTAVSASPTTTAQATEATAMATSSAKPLRINGQFRQGPLPGLRLLVRHDMDFDRRRSCGYWRKPELTAGVLRNGWLRTGDIGVLGADGNLTLVGRRGDMYIRGGYNVHPGEVERALASHPNVKQAAVVGRSAPVIGEIGVACVVPADAAAPPTLAELRAHVAGELADYKAPDELLIVDEVPLTAMLKPDRLALRELIVLHDRDIQRRQRTAQ